MRKGMKTAITLAVMSLLLPAAASAHPHMWISQTVRMGGEIGRAHV